MWKKLFYPPFLSLYTILNNSFSFFFFKFQFVKKVTFRHYKLTPSPLSLSLKFTSKASLIFSSTCLTLLPCLHIPTKSLTRNLHLWTLWQLLYINLILSLNTLSQELSDSDSLLIQILNYPHLSNPISKILPLLHKTTLLPLMQPPCPHQVPTRALTRTPTREVGASSSPFQTRALMIKRRRHHHSFNLHPLVELSATRA